MSVSLLSMFKNWDRNLLILFAKPMALLSVCIQRILCLGLVVTFAQSLVSNFFYLVKSLDL